MSADAGGSASPPRSTPSGLARGAQRDQFLPRGDAPRRGRSFPGKTPHARGGGADARRPSPAGGPVARPNAADVDRVASPSLDAVESVLRSGRASGLHRRVAGRVAPARWWAAGRRAMEGQAPSTASGAGFVIADLGKEKIIARTPVRRRQSSQPLPRRASLRQRGPCSLRVRAAIGAELGPPCARCPPLRPCVPRAGWARPWLRRVRSRHGRTGLTASRATSPCP
jgi:hypothetical protein